MADRYRPLSLKQARFCEEYLIDRVATLAATRAGYSAASARDTGPRLLRNPAVKKKIDELVAERSRRTKIDADWVLQRLVELHQRCMQEIKPAVDRRGRPLQDDNGNALYTFNAAGAARALELLGKHVQVSAFEERHVHDFEFDFVGRLMRGRERVAKLKEQREAQVIEGDAIDVTPAQERKQLNS